VTNLADDFFCLMLDEHSGKPRIAPRVAGVGLGAGLLAEVVISGHCVMTEAGEIQALNVQRPDDALSREVHELLLNRPHHRDPGIWISYLARDSFARVGDRLAEQGAVSRVRRRGMTGVRVTYQPTNLTTVAWPAIRIAQELTGGAEITLTDLTCAGLAVATGLINNVLWDSGLHQTANAALPAALTLLPPPVTTLLARAETAVADAVLTNRTT
jgi:hypothetical protein